LEWHEAGAGRGAAGRREVGAGRSAADRPEAGARRGAAGLAHGTGGAVGLLPSSRRREAGAELPTSCYWTVARGGRGVVVLTQVRGGAERCRPDGRQARGGAPSAWPEAGEGGRTGWLSPAWISPLRSSAAANGGGGIRVGVGSSRGGGWD
jgi:hypothetical protein